MKLLAWLLAILCLTGGMALAEDVPDALLAALAEYEVITLGYYEAGTNGAAAALVEADGGNALCVLEAWRDVDWHITTWSGQVMPGIPVISSDRPGRFCIQFLESLSDLPGHRSENAHQLGIKQIPTGNILFANTGGYSIIQQALQNFFQRHFLGDSLHIFINSQGFQDAIRDIGLVAFFDHSGVQTILNQRSNVSIDHNKPLTLLGCRL